MPIPIITRQRFKCQFCLSYRATLKAVEKHEGFCWQNPNRWCDLCDNTGKIGLGVGDNINDPEYYDPCPYCSKEDKKLTASLKASHA